MCIGACMCAEFVYMLNWDFGHYESLFRFGGSACKNFLVVQTYYRGGFALSQKNEMFRASANVYIFMVLCSHENDIFHGGLELSWWKCFFSRVLHTITNHFFAVLMSFSDHELNLFGSRLPRKLTRRLASLPQQNSILVTFDSWDHGSFSWRES